uniref:Osteoclast-stimulating factor 1 n=1 Tax=Petromyzon marinus TaxID=7757 RepID=A0AAJ7SXK0_PETMA|nr:LOW QUALITY PROTEIN: osteoclast-stimulating factor 1-like [Petromyzon marinus]
MSVKPVPPKPTKPGVVKVYRALYTFEPRTPDELYFEEGDILYVTDTSDPNWWKGTCKGRSGLVPSNYVVGAGRVHRQPPAGGCQERKRKLAERVPWTTGVSVNGLDKAGKHGHLLGAHGGHRDVVEILLGHPNIELNHQNKLGDTTLHAAAWKGYPDIVEMLLTKGALTDVRNNEKKLALDMATDPRVHRCSKRRSTVTTGRTISQDDDYLDDEDSD